MCVCECVTHREREFAHMQGDPKWSAHGHHCLARDKSRNLLVYSRISEKRGEWEDMSGVPKTTLRFEDLQEIKIYENSMIIRVKKEVRIAL